MSPRGRSCPTGAACDGRDGSIAGYGIHPSKGGCALAWGVALKGRAEGGRAGRLLLPVCWAHPEGRCLTVAVLVAPACRLSLTSRSLVARRGVRGLVPGATSLSPVTATHRPTHPASPGRRLTFRKQEAAAAVAAFRVWSRDRATFPLHARPRRPTRSRDRLSRALQTPPEAEPPLNRRVHLARLACSWIGSVGFEAPSVGEVLSPSRARDSQPAPPSLEPVPWAQRTIRSEPSRERAGPLRDTVHHRANARVWSEQRKLRAGA